MTKLSFLKWCCFFLLLGRGWQHFAWDIPLRTFFWNEGLLSPIIEGLFRVQWADYVRSPVLDGAINLTSKILGVFYFVTAFICLKIEKYQKVWKLLPLCSFFLLILFSLQFMAKFFYVGMLIEHGVQLMTPMFLYWYLREGWDQRLVTKIKLALAATFVGHGLFAIGFHPVPGHFMDMLMNVFGVENEAARFMLLLAGSLDLACSVFLFFPVLDRYALFFMSFWGLTTALARFVAHLDFGLMALTTNQWMPETIYRLPHGLLAVILVLVFMKKLPDSKVNVA